MKNKEISAQVAKDTRVQPWFSTSLLGCAAILGGLTACSPYIFSENAKTLSLDVSTIKTAYTGTANQIANEQSQYKRLLFIRDRPVVLLSPGCADNALKCELLSIDDAANAFTNAVHDAKSANVSAQRISHAQQQVNSANQAVTAAASKPSASSKKSAQAEADNQTRLQQQAALTAVTEARLLENELASGKKTAAVTNDVSACTVDVNNQAKDSLTLEPKTLNKLQVSGLLQALQNYTAALSALTNAQDRADFDNASSNLSTAVGSFIGGIATASGVAAPLAPAVSELADTSSNLVLWLVGEDLDYRRLKKLKLAVSTASLPMHTLTQALGVNLDDQSKQRQSVLKELLSFQVNAMNSANAAKLNDKDFGTAFDNAQAAADAFQAVKESSPVEVVQALSEAHDQLVNAIYKNDDISFTNLANSLQTFSTLANNLANAALATAKAK